MKKLWLLAVFLAFLLPTSAQQVPATANLTAQDSGACTTANACLSVNIPVNGASAVIQLSGTWSGTVQFEASTGSGPNGSPFTAINGTPVAGTAAVNNSSANGAWRFNVASVYVIRVRVSTYTSGTIQAAITASTASSFSGGGTGGGGGGGGLTGSGTPGNFAEWDQPTDLTNAPTLDLNGIIQNQDPVAQPSSSYYCLNSASGTTNGLLVTRDANGACINNPTANLNYIRGVVLSGGGTSGTSIICKIGSCDVILDNTSAINDCIVAAASGSEGHDAGPVPCPTGEQQIGLAQSVNGGAGTAAKVDVFIFDIEPSPAGPTQTIQINNTTVAGTFPNLNNTTPAAQTNFLNCFFQTDNGIPISDISLECPQATASQNGFVRLAGDLNGGTAAAPHVTGIQTIPVTFTSPAARDVICFPTTSTLANCPLGVPVRTVSGNSDTILATDRVTDVRYTAASGATAVTLPQAGSTGFASNFTAVLTNAQGSGTVTVTPTTSTINGASTLAITSGQFCFIYSDNTNYFANCANSGGGGSVTLSVPTELLVNGAQSATAGTLNITKQTEQPANFWAGPISASFANIVQTHTSVCSGGGITNCNVAFTTNVGAGNALLLFYAGTSGAPTSIAVTDSLLQTFTLGNSTTFQARGPNVFYFCNTVSGADTITATPNVSVGDIELTAVEVGGAGVSCFDQAREASAGTVSPYTVSTAGSVAQSSELILSLFKNLVGGSVITGWNAGAGNSLVSQVTCSGSVCASSTSQMLEAQNLTTGLSGAQTATATQVGSPQVNPTTLIIAIKLSTTGSAVPTFRQIVATDLPLRAGFISNCNNSAAPAEVTGTTAETVFAFNCVIPANTLAVGSRIAVSLYGVYTMNGAGDTTTIKVKACQVAGCGSGTIVNLGSTGAVTPGVTTANLGWHLTDSTIDFTLGSTGTLDSQGEAILSTAVGTAQIAALSNSTTVTVNTTVDEYISISAQNSVSSDTITLRNAIISAQ